MTPSFTDLAATGPWALRRAACFPLRALARLAVLLEARAVSLVVVNDDGVLLRVRDGAVVLDAAWPGWDAVPGLPGDLGVPHTVAPLGLLP